MTIMLYVCMKRTDLNMCIMFINIRLILIVEE
jgi:hypothetical protein